MSESTTSATLDDLYYGDETAGIPPSYDESGDVVTKDVDDCYTVNDFCAVGFDNLDRIEPLIDLGNGISITQLEYPTTAVTAPVGTTVTVPIKITAKGVTKPVTIYANYSKSGPIADMQFDKEVFTPEELSAGVTATLSIKAKIYPIAPTVGFSGELQNVVIRFELIP